MMTFDDHGENCGENYDNCDGNCHDNNDDKFKIFYD